jgi:hypothetical protein
MNVGSPTQHSCLEGVRSAGMLDLQQCCTDLTQQSHFESQGRYTALTQHSHFEDEACIEVCIQQLLARPPIEKERALHETPLPGYVSIGLLQMRLGYIWLDALPDMTAGRPPFVHFTTITVI